MTKSEAREILFTLVFEAEFNPEKSASEIYEIAKEERGFENFRYIKKALEYIVANRNELVSMIESHSEEWNFSRMSAATRAVLLIGTYDMKIKNLAPDIAINEAVNLSKKYDEDSAYPFVNGVLNSVKDAPVLSAADEE